MTTQPTATVLCDCPRLCDLWRCRGRPDLDVDPEGRQCELGELVRTTGTDTWRNDRRWPRYGLCR